MWVFAKKSLFVIECDKSSLCQPQCPSAFQIDPMEGYIKTPDIKWNGKFWEIKSITSEKAVDSALRKAIKQIENDPGGVVINCVNSMDNEKLIWLINNRIHRSAKNDFDVLILNNKNTMKILRYEK